MSGICLFPQHGLVHRRQRPDARPDEHPRTAARDPPLHHPRAPARAPAPHVHGPGGDGLDGVEADGVVAAFAAQVDEPGAGQGQEDAGQEPEAEGAPEGGREEGEEVGDLDRHVGRAEGRERRQRRQVAQRQHLVAQAPGFDRQRDQLDPRHRAREAAHAVERRR